MTRRAAGLPLSVGKASRGVRLVIAVVLFGIGAICVSGGLVIAATHPAGKFLAVLVVIPLAFVAVLAALFVLAPWSRYGVWLDHFVPQLSEPKIALVTAMLLWLGAFLITWRR